MTGWRESHSVSPSPPPSPRLPALRTPPIATLGAKGVSVQRLGVGNQRGLKEELLSQSSESPVFQYSDSSKQDLFSTTPTQDPQAQQRDPFQSDCYETLSGMLKICALAMTLLDEVVRRLFPCVPSDKISTI